jgi:integrase
MSVREYRNKHYLVDIFLKGRRFRKKSPDNTKAGAVAYEAVLRNKLARGESIEEIGEDSKPTLTFRQFSKKWLDVHVVPNNKYSEQKQKRSILKCWLLPFFGKMPIDQITAHDVELFKARGLREGLAKKTINNHLAVLKKCVATAYEWEKILGVPPKINWFKCPPAQTKHLSPDECSLLLSHSEGVLREMILVGLRTGMRQGELIALQWSSISWENQSITVRHNQCYYNKTLISPKNNRVRTIPMDVEVYEMLFKRKKDTGYVFTDKNNEPIGGRGLLARLKKAAHEAGVGNVGWHALRHTFATQLVMRGAPMNAVQTLLGHSTILMTMRYSHVAPSSLASVIGLLNPKNTHLRQPDGNEWNATIQQETKNAEYAR